MTWLIETWNGYPFCQIRSTSVRYYEIRLLDLLGFRPDLTNCVRCEAEIKA